MSRVGNAPISIPDGVTLTMDADVIKYASTLKIVYKYGADLSRNSKDRALHVTFLKHNP